MLKNNIHQSLPSRAFPKEIQIIQVTIIPKLQQFCVASGMMLPVYKVNNSKLNMLCKKKLTRLKYIGFSPTLFNISLVDFL